MESDLYTSTLRWGLKFWTFVLAIEAYPGTCFHANIYLRVSPPEPDKSFLISHHAKLDSQ